MLSWLSKRPAAEPPRLAIGLMSGTSLDALDAALIREADGRAVEVLTLASSPFPPELKTRLDALVCGGTLTAEALLSIETEYTDCFAKLCQTVLEQSPEPVSVIGFHGQTLWHAPESQATWQLGLPERLAQATCTPVVARFRQGDMARGGQGAPLAPLFHAAQFARDAETVAVLNLGGIANVTILKPGAPPTGWDLGPANTLSDLWHRTHFGAPFDALGAKARSGSVHDALLKRMLADPFFQKSPPKSTGREYFNLAWLNAHLKAFDPISAEDVQATLNQLTARLVKNALPAEVDLLVACGGGVKNDHLMGCIDYEVDALLVTSDLFEIDPQAVECACFGWLALQRLSERSLETQSITGAKTPGLLGTVFRPSLD